MGSPELTERQPELMGAFVRAWDVSHIPFDLTDLPFEHPDWPGSVPPPTREEVRALVHAGGLEADGSVAPMWRVFPSAQGRRDFGGAGERDLSAALADPDRRLGVILEATVAAFEADPSEPLHFAPMEQIDLVQHAHWPLSPDVVKAHDLQQLIELGLVSSTPRGRDSAFWPTSDGRAAVHDPAAFLERRADAIADDSEASRLRRWAVRLRASDVAVGAAGGLTGGLIRALIGL
jgi:hypothetical protein